MMENLTEDEKRLVKLFRCLDSYGQDKILIEAASRILRVTPIQHYYFSANPIEEGREELKDPISYRLYCIVPHDSKLTDLHNCDYHFAEIAWEDEVTNILLGTSEYDKEAADQLVEAYFEGAHEFDVPLLTEFGATEDEMTADLKNEALKLINSWREQILNYIEERCELKQKDREV